jgi:predicted TIM-barrel fold metal-dependent hydrolase
VDRLQLPFLPAESSNGEFVPRDATGSERAIVAATLERVADAARAVNLDRRTVLRSAGGVAALLAIVNLAACSNGGERTQPSTSAEPPSGETTSSMAPSTTAPGSSAPGGTYEVPDEVEDVAACEQALSGTEFIVDVHTHHVVPDGPWRQNAPRIADMIRGLVPSGCLEADRYECLNRAAYIHGMFVASDTAVALLSDVPNSGPDDAPMPFADAVTTADFVSALANGGEPRLLVHNVIAPNFGFLPARLDDMTSRVATGRVAAFKVYTAWGPDRRGFDLDDPAIGLPVVEHARSLGVRIMCAHKGLPLLEFDRTHNGPRDLVATAAQYPDMDFVVYHSAFELQTTERTYDPRHAATGINSLIKALDDHGIPPNANVWAELGTTWRELMRAPTEAAHALGKLLSRVGENRVLWGTDGIWYGSPQPQIMAFRAFQISAEFQERYGYPALTDDLKRKVLGLNASRLFGLDPAAQRCTIDATTLEDARTSGAVPISSTPRGPMTRREILTWLADPRTRTTPI